MNEAAMFTVPLSLFLLSIYSATSQTHSHKVCGPSTFGWKCNFTCACRSGPCDPLDGHCDSGCQDGKYGFGCQLDDACMYDIHGINYTGSVSIAQNDSTCLDWSDPIVLVQGFSVEDRTFPPGDVPENFCRNPRTPRGQYAVKPWCFTSNETTSFTFCDNPTHCSCPDGLFGPACNRFCHCKNTSEACDKVHGSCTSGCSEGWTGRDCQQECAPGRYGLNCKQQCDLCYNRVCDSETGSCVHGCEPGYNGTYCTEECSSGWYGRDCARRCGNCSLGEYCHAKTGACFRGCAVGFKGKTCTVRKCPEGRFGKDCSQRCNCTTGTVCHAVTGTCLTITVLTHAQAEGLPLKYLILACIGGSVLAVGLFILLCYIGVTIRRRKEKEYHEQEKAFLEGAIVLETKRTDHNGQYDPGQFEEYDVRYETVA